MKVDGLVLDQEKAWTVLSDKGLKFRGGGGGLAMKFDLRPLWTLQLNFFLAKLIIFIYTLVQIFLFLFILMVHTKDFLQNFLGC